MTELKFHMAKPFTEKGSWKVKGYLFPPGGTCLRGKELIAWLESTGPKPGAMSAADLKAILRDVTGLFALVFEHGGKVLLATDHIRSLPLFYALQDASFQVSDSASLLRDHMSPRPALDKRSRKEFLCTGYVLGFHTLLEGLCQVEAAQVVELQAGQVTRSFYWSYQNAVPTAQDKQNQLQSLHDISQAVFRRLIDFLDGRTAVIPLSGGYDSRFILGMLAEMKYPKLIAFSYGREGNREMEVAAQVAQGLGVPFIPMVYNEDLIHDFEKDPEFLSYVDHNAHYSSMFFLQEYFALKHLKEKALVPEDSVFVPGHSGDFVAGSMLLKMGLPRQRESLRKTMERIIDQRFIYRSRLRRTELLKGLKQNLRSKLLVEDASSYSMFEDWDFKEKLAKFIVNSCLVYRWFGYDLALPFYDTELLNFFRDLPYESKANKVLYDTFLREGLFQRLGINLKDEIQPGPQEQRLAYLKSRIKKYLPEFLLPSNFPVNDDLFYHEITARLQSDMEGKGHPIEAWHGSHNSLIIAWYLAHLHIQEEGRNSQQRASQ